MDTLTHIGDTGALPQRRVATISARLDNGMLVEMVYDPTRRRTAFALWRDGRWTLEPTVLANPIRRLVPYSPENNLVRNGVVLFPSGPEEYDSEASLVAAIRAYLHRYVDLSPVFERIATYYVLLTWLYDDFAELPYLRVRGDPGSGKTRFLLTVGALCYKPIFASGASTVSPLFRLLDTFRGTLVIDEGDFRLSDEKAEVVKILNNGNAKGFPVLRSEVSPRGEFNPRAYAVFGPKVIATRGYFEDRALESRCLTEEMGHGRLREDIPINEPASAREEAMHLRNQLLLFRFRNLGKRRASDALVDRAIEPRLSQIFVPLASVIDDRETQQELQALAREYQRELVAERGMDAEAQILEVIGELTRGVPDMTLAIKDIARRFVEEYGDEYDRKITPKWVGSIVRRRLGLRAYKSHGTFVIADGELAKLPHLRERYGIEEEPRVDMGTSGTFPGGGQA